MTTPVIGHPHTQNEVFKDFLNNQPVGWQSQKFLLLAN
jgi:hypothetical protein